MNLIIVESPTKARTLTRFLNGAYQVEATLGHIRDLPKSELGVDVEKNLEPTYVIPRARQKRVWELRKLAEKADGIILATDPDREGEAIAWHTLEVIRDMKHVTRTKENTKTASPDVSRVTSHVSRIVFHEITESAIKEALENPRAIDLQLVDAQQARRVLDRLVGYKLSPLLWQKLSRRWLSAGRVQSVAVRLIVEREREIEKFTKEEFWTIEGVFSLWGSAAEVGETFLAHPSSPSSSSPSAPSVSGVTVLKKAHLPASPQASQAIHATLVVKDGVKYEKTITLELFDGAYTTMSSTINTEQAARDIIADLKAPYTVSAVDKKEVRRSPYPPYTTSTLQQDAGRRLGFSAKRTMQLAQKLYEEGLITYHRTDSFNLADKFISQARDFIAKEYGKDYVVPAPRRYKTKSKVAQEAHEAIRPTDPKLTNLSNWPNLSNAELNRDHIRLYDLIWKRAVATQAAEAVFDSTTITIASSNGYEFQAQGSVIKFEGFLKITGREVEETVVPDVAVGQALTLSETIPTQHLTSPPPRYTEASLVKALEEKGIGRPSTYAPIISTIQERQYVTKEDKKLLPTDLGITVTDFLVKYFPKVIDLPFTAALEDDLDAIANGQKQWQLVVAAFYEPFAQDLEKTYETATKVQVPVEELDETCPECKVGKLVIRTGRYGKFIACNTFPKCKYTRQFLDKIGMPCPRCGGDIVIKKSKRGKTFYGCSNYPKCNFAAWKKEDIK
ncbi:type I DNA topoisomerase [Candidatus Gottesmanbacteria bacterium]|nr:type I DNA topoisomerase [Candidatus Gottesmanbacteria bacterium]